MSLETGFSETMLTVPVTRGSRMKFFPVCWPTVLITDWMSAFTKLTVIFSFSSDDGAAWPNADPARRRPSRAGASRRAANEARNLVTFWGFSVDLSGHFAPIIGRLPLPRKRGPRLAPLPSGRGFG
jgi:hypothetical protein